MTIAEPSPLEEEQPFIEGWKRTASHVVVVKGGDWWLVELGVG
jgi:hypothetical protein